ncbi:epididymal secretory protein E1-like [Pseudomyrmex gracilis]|uniref:epididymal secretory protein E1-like n=1 Tax=Pseudomyrmex gracilis TaxID=219809 RepID=UPI000994BDD7|nr:epididymal secretory protein E1-like [Pseudomyrmex gracilis]
MKTSACVYIIVAFCVALSLQATPHNPCDKGPLPVELRVDGCNSLPCNLYRGTNLTAQWDFVADSDSTKLTTRVKVTIFGITVEYPYPQPDACKSLSSGKCPLKKGDKATYTLVMPIEKSYPHLTLNIEFRLDNEQSEPQVCFKLDGKVTTKYSPLPTFL